MIWWCTPPCSCATFSLTLRNAAITDLVAANTAGAVTGGVIAFGVIAVGFLSACALLIWWRAHADATRVAAYFEDDHQPVCDSSSCAKAIAPFFRAQRHPQFLHWYDRRTMSGPTGSLSNIEGLPLDPDQT